MQQQAAIDDLMARTAAMKMALEEMTMTLEECRGDVDPDSAFDDAALKAAEDKLMQIMMDLMVNTNNVNTLTGEVDDLVVTYNTEEAAIALV